MQEQRKLGSVLIVEDDGLVLEILRRICGETFAELVVERSASAALPVIEARSFELLITDLRMPGANGLVLLSAARQKWPSLPLLLISGYADDEATARARSLGAHVLHKPFGAKSLRQAIFALCPRPTSD